MKSLIFYHKDLYIFMNKVFYKLQFSTVVLVNFINTITFLHQNAVHLYIGRKYILGIFYANFHASVILLYFVQIFMKYSPKCRTKKLGMIYTPFWDVFAQF